MRLLLFKHTLQLWMIVIALSSAMLTTFGLPAAEQGDAGNSVYCECVADVWISAYQGEQTYSMGRTSILKLKGYGEWSLMRFNLKKVRRHSIRSARLWMHGARPFIDLTKGTVEEIKAQRYKVNRLRVISLSTVSQTWTEGIQSDQYKEDARGHGATFLEASFGRKQWAWNGDSNLSDVILTNGNTLASHVELRREEKGDGRWFSVPVDPKLVYAMISGDSDGLAVLDGSGQTMENNFINSRESKFSPYLTMQLVEPDSTPPTPPTELRLEPASRFATLNTGAALLTFKPPKDAFCYFITINGNPLERWKTPHPDGSGRESIRIKECSPKETMTVEIVVDDGRGNRSKPVATSGSASPSLSLPAPLPAIKHERSPGAPALRAGGLKVWAVPDIVSVCPQTGRIYNGADNGLDFRQSNPVWNGANNTVKLFGCRGEILAFQLVFEGNTANITLHGERLVKSRPGEAAEQSIPAKSWEFFREWYVQPKAKKKKDESSDGTESVNNSWIPEIALPLNVVGAMCRTRNLPTAGLVSLPDSLNGIPGQKNQSIWVDLYIPKNVEPGEYSGGVQISSNGAPAFSLPVHLKIYPFIMPDTLSFVPIMNTYLRSNDKLFDVYRIAHKHRVCFYRCALGARIRGRSNYFTPEIEGEGDEMRVSDWSRYDRIYGPLLDGSLFADLPRGPVPVACFRLPLCEDWPSDHDAGYPYREPYPRDLMHPKKTTAAWMVETHHAMKGPLPSVNAYSREYRDGVANVVRDFVLHAKEKGWTRTEMQCMPNSKIYYRNKWTTRAMWRYDEPMFRDDFLATAVQSKIFHAGLRLAGDDADAVHFVFRQDISRPEWQFDTLDGNIEEILVGGYWESHRQRRAAILRNQIPCEIDNYSSYGEVGSNLMTQPSLIMASWLTGCKKTLQWQTFVDAKNLAVDGRPLVKADRLAMLIYTKRWNRETRQMESDPAWDEPVLVSIRTKGLRRGQQDVEIMSALRKMKKYNLEQMNFLLREYIGAGLKNQEAHFAEEAVGVDIQGMNVNAIMRLREQALMALSEKPSL